MPQAPQSLIAVVRRGVGWCVWGGCWVWCVLGGARSGAELLRNHRADLALSIARTGPGPVHRARSSSADLALSIARLPRCPRAAPLLPRMTAYLASLQVEPRLAPPPPRG